MIFFWRRTIFIAATVFLFEYPLMQMYVHNLLSLIALVLLIVDRQGFDTKAQRMVEIASEALLFITSIFLMQFMNANLDLKQVDLLKILVFACFGHLFAINVAFMIWFFVSECREKQRKKQLVE